MKTLAVNLLIICLIITVFPGSGICNVHDSSRFNEPDPNTPWPVAFSLGGMNVSHTLMNSYGDPNGTWADACFHAGIDIDATTGDPYPCNEVRSVADGYATHNEEVPIPDHPDSLTEWVVIICDELGGVTQRGWSYGHLDEPVIDLLDPIAKGDLIGYMTENITYPHLHFMWSDWNNNWHSWVNPLKYLDPTPTSEDNFTWTFNPLENDPPFKYFFLPQIWYSDWEDLSVGDTEQLMLDPDLLFGDVDFFFGIALRGDGMPGGMGTGRNDLAAQKIKYSVVRELADGEQTLETRHVVDFDCVLASTPGVELRAQMLYFRHSMLSMFGKDGLLYCLSNSERTSSDWDGINTIQENSWNTDAMEVDVSTSTVNPVLAGYPDGEYRVDVLCYSFDDDYTFNDSIVGIELHNFHPALGEVIITDALTDHTYYHATWVPDATGLEADLSVSAELGIPPGAEIDVVLVFTESMNSSLSAALGSLSITNGIWSDSEVSNDTWTGTTTIPSNGFDYSYTLSVTATDTDSNSLMDPEGAGSVPGPASDTHHVISIADGIVLDWTASIHAPLLSSPKLADMDGDGDLDIIIQTADGWVDVLDDDGSSMSGWPVSGGWSTGDPDVYASPAIVNLTGGTLPNVLAVHPYGCNGYTSSGTAISGWSGVYSSNYKWHILSSPAGGDLDGDGDNEYVLGRQYVQGFPNLDNVFARNGNGSAYWDTRILGSSSSVSATVSICDLTNDGYPEVLAVADMMSYYPASTDMTAVLFCLDGMTGEEIWENVEVGGLLVFGAVVTGNLDSDPQMEVVVGATAGSNAIKVIDGSDGSIEKVMATAGPIYSGASIADVNSSGTNNVVLSCANNSTGGGILYCWDATTGNNIPGFPVELNSYTRSGVSIGDIDCDGNPELVFSGNDGCLYAVNHDGTIVSGFPVPVPSCNQLSGQVALGDIDSDGKLEIIFGEVENSVLYCYEMGENSAYASLSWPQFQFDAMNSGCYSEVNQPPGPPSNLQETSSILGNKIIVDLTWNLSPNDPGDVTEYRIYRQIFPYGGLEQIGTVSAGVTTCFDAFRLYPYYGVVRYHLTAWDGEFESEESNGVRINLQPDNCISTFCPVSEVHSSQADGIRENSDRSEPVENLSCSVLTDGEFSRAYTPSDFTECVEIDLGMVHQVENVSVIRSTADGMNREETETLTLFSYSLSTDGTGFAGRETGAARYVRVYGAAGATEIEVYGTSDGETSSALIDVVRNDSGAFTAQSVNGEELTLQVFDLMGRTIWQGTSADQVSWPSVNSSGNRVPSGVYLLRVESESMETLTAKVVVR